MNEPPPTTPDRLHELLRDVASIQRQQLRQANLLPQVQSRLEAGRLASLRAHARLSLRRLTLPLTAGGLGLGAVAAAVVLWMQVPAPLSFVVGQAELSGRSGEIVAAQSDGQTPVRFSDGSHLALDPGARLQVVGVAAGGATVAMERGAVEVEVVHRASTHWVIQAGPFAVTVTGTRFLLAWEPESETLSVDMHEGSVEVTGGPASAAARSGHSTVRTGQSLRVSRRTGHYELGASTGAVTARTSTSAAATATAANPPADLPVPAVPTAPSPAQEIAPAPSRAAEAPAAFSAARSLRTAALPAASDETWRRLAVAARYPEALRAVERIGFDASCRRLGAEDLVLLGDVARLAGKPARAEKAYLTARNRFPALDRPLFALGLTAFEQRHDYGRAAAWFEQYLQHYPGGALTREAAGRALESWRRAGETDRAQQAARDYLARYPSGPHAALARQTIGR